MIESLINSNLSSNIKIIQTFEIIDAIDDFHCNDERQRSNDSKHSKRFKRIKRRERFKR